MNGREDVGDWGRPMKPACPACDQEQNHTTQILPVLMPRTRATLSLCAAAIAGIMTAKNYGQPCLPARKTAAEALHNKTPEQPAC